MTQRLPILTYAGLQSYTRICSFSALNIDRDVECHTIRTVRLLHEGMSELRFFWDQSVNPPAMQSRQAGFDQSP